MTDAREKLEPETMTRLSQATRMALYLIETHDRLSEDAVAWAKEMFWLQKPWMSSGAARFGDSLEGRTLEVGGIQSEVLRTLQALRNRLVAMLDLAVTRGDAPRYLLTELEETIDEEFAAAPGLVDVRFRQMPVDQAISEMAEDVLEHCVWLQRQNERLEAAMRQLPELKYA